MRVIVIGRFKQLDRHLSPVGEEYLQKLFKGWKLAGRRVRGKHFSLCFVNSNLVQKGIDEIHPIEDGDLKTNLYPTFKTYINETLNPPENYDETLTDYSKYLQGRGFKGVRVLLRRHRRLIKDMKENGMKEPILIKDNGIVDGDHRYLVAKELGINKIICKTLQK